VILPNYNARDLLAANVRRLMDEHPDKSSPSKLARRCFWPAGAKQGKRVSERQIRYVLDTRTDSVPPVPSPTLDLVIAIGNAFDVPAWQLLVDDRQLRTWMVGKLFSASEAVSDAQVERHLPLPPAEREAPAAKKEARGDDRA
jgi:hypothetical protein